MITEFVILFTVQYFQKRRERISLIVCADFINFIQKHQRILDTCLTNSICDASGHCSYICFSVSPDFCLIPHSAKRNPYIRLLQCLCKRFGDRCFSGSRRSHQTQDRALPFFRQRTYCQKFQNSFFDLFQTIMICFQHFLCIFDILIVFPGFIPRHLKQCFNIGSYHTAFCRTVQ